MAALQEVKGGNHRKRVLMAQVGHNTGYKVTQDAPAGTTQPLVVKEAVHRLWRLSVCRHCLGYNESLFQAQQEPVHNSKFLRAANFKGHETQCEVPGRRGAGLG